MKTINEFVQNAYSSAVDRGFHTDPTEFGTLLALIHTEVTEVLTAPTKQEQTEEFADILIRTFDLSGYQRIPLDKAFMEQTKQENLHDILSFVTDLPGIKESSVPEICLHLHTLLTETMETYRFNVPLKEKRQQLAQKLCGVSLYIFQACHMLQLDIHTSLVAKMEKNKKRPYKHNKIV